MKIGDGGREKGEGEAEEGCAVCVLGDVRVYWKGARGCGGRWITYFETLGVAIAVGFPCDFVVFVDNDAVWPICVAVFCSTDS